MRILLVSQMYPGPADPDLGSFVAQLERALRDRGHEIELAVLDRRGGGKARFLELRRKIRAAGPHDVVWAHFLVPSGLLAARAGGPLVVTAHGRDVRNIGAIPGVAGLTARVVERATTLIAVSEYLRRELEERLPAARGKVEVVDSGVDLERFRPVEPAARLESPAFVHVGSLTERKNVVRLADAFATLGRGSLTFVGDGPLRGRLEGRERVRVVGRVPHDEVPAWLAAADVVCAPALIEPFGQSILEAMACERTVVATRLGGPPEFVTAESGVLVDPLDADALARALETAAAFPTPNEAARRAAEPHDVRRQAERVEEILLRAVRDRPA
ncbi:MAG TPA: glycosyltransferase [Gaiellaceae bacterium]|jgi:glycosyltransferase involved in cell wall biosynthesis|nr:glycosyltransferase [Gaiellaceae bacterium]